MSWDWANRTITGGIIPANGETEAYVDIIIQGTGLGGTVKAIASKSMAHRLLICSALSDKPVELICGGSSEDIEATVRCLNALGACITKTDLGFHIVPISAASPNALLDCGESGSTYRFMLPIACSLGVNAAFHTSGRLPQRPLSPLYEELTAHGCSLSAQGTVPLRCTGRLEHGKYTLSGGISSQFISGLLFALPLLSGDSMLEITGQIESRPYVDLTLSALSEFKIDISEEENRFFIKGNQSFVSPGRAVVEGDWSNAAFWLCAGAISDKTVTCTGLNTASLQGDRVVLDILKSFGANVKIHDDGITVSGGGLRGIEIDARHIPDLVPVLATVASVSGGKTQIKNAGRLRFKESDRLYAVEETLKALGADIRQTGDGLVINGKELLPGGRVSSFGDHRIAMSAAIAASRCRKPVVITGAEAVDKSYPGFFSDYMSLGGCVKTL